MIKLEDRVLIERKPEFFSNDELQSAKALDLFTYLRRYEPNELVHFSGQEWTTKTHGSLKISNGKWHWHSRGIGGRSALDYLIKVRGWAIIRAVKHINYCLRDPPDYKPRTQDKNTIPEEWQTLPGFTLKLPPRKKNSKRLIAYLCGKRALEYEVVVYCIRAGILYQSEEIDEKTKREINNAVFLGKDEAGTVRYVMKRGLTDVRYVNEVEGSDKSYSFRICSKGRDTVHVFESAIDAMSYSSLLILAGKDWLQHNYLALAGGLPQSQRSNTISRIPLALQRYLNDYPGTRKVMLHLDNDKGGKLAAINLMALLSDEMQVENRPPPEGKDVNDYLVLLKERRKFL